MALSRFWSLVVAVLTVCFLPFSIGGLLVNYTARSLTHRQSLRKHFRRTTGFRAKSVLITGVSTPYGLRLARAFHQVGHDVVGVDYQDTTLPLHGRLSTSLLKFRRLKSATSTDLVRELMSLIWSESIDLWIDCSRAIPPTTLATAKRVIERSTSCICFVPSDQVVQSFTTTQSFLAFAHGHGLPVPDSYSVKSRDEIHNVLNQSRGKKRYVLTEPSSPIRATSRALLPRRTLSQTYNEVARYKVSDGSQWVLEQYVEGLQRFKTFSIIAGRELQAFTACQESRSGSYQVPSSKTLRTALTRYVASLAESLGHSVSCHLTVDFCIDEKATDTGVEQRVLPISGQVTADTSGLLFQGRDGAVDLVRAYLSALSPKTNGSMASNTNLTNGVDEGVLKPSTSSKEIYSLGNDISRLGQSILGVMKLQSSLSFTTGIALDVIRHILSDQECVYDFNDPLPCWYLYQIYLPIRLFASCFQGSQKRAQPQEDLQLTMR